MTTNASRWACVFLILCIAGCTGSSAFPDTYPVTGTVKLKGKPIEGAIVSFQLEGGRENAIGTTNSQGEFKLSMFKPSDGAIPGQYRVSVKKPVAAPENTPAVPEGQMDNGELANDYAPPSAEPTAAAPKTKSEIPEKYSDDNTSGLRATVTESNDNHFDFDLE